MDGEPVLWDNHNRRHITEDHPERAITIDEVQQALNDPRRVEDEEHRGDATYYSVVGGTRTGRLLYIVYLRRVGGWYPVHARQAGRKLSKEYKADG